MASAVNQVVFNYDRLKNYQEIIDKAAEQNKDELLNSAREELEQYLHRCLEAGHNFNRVVDPINGNTVLHLAIKDKKLDITNALIKAKANCEIENYAAMTARALAKKDKVFFDKVIWLKNDRDVSCSTSSNPIVLYKTESQRTPSENKSTINALVNKEVQSDKRLSNIQSNNRSNDEFSNFKNEVFELVQTGNLEELKIKKKLSKPRFGHWGKWVNDTKKSLLHVAFQFGQLEVVKWLVDQCYIDPFSTGLDADGFTLAHIAAAQNNAQMIRFLISMRSAKHEIQDKKGRTPIFIAAENGALDVAYLLMKDDSVLFLDRRSNDNSTLLHVAAKNEHFAFFSFILQQHAIYKGEYSEKKLKEIISWDNDQGMTALHMAASTTHLGLARTLLKFGASPHRKDKNGLTSIDIAKKSGNENMVYLLEKGALKTPVELSWSELIEMPKNKTPHQVFCCVQDLIKQGADVDKYDEYGNSCLHNAIQTGNRTLAKILISCGASVNLPTLKEGYTSLHLAKMLGDEEMYDYLISINAIKIMDSSCRLPDKMPLSKGMRKAIGIDE